MNEIEAEEIVYDQIPLKRYLAFYNTYTTYNLYWEKRPTEPYKRLMDCNRVKAKKREANRITLVVNVSKLLLDPEFADMNAKDTFTEVVEDKSTTVKDFRQLLVEKFS